METEYWIIVFLLGLSIFMLNLNNANPATRTVVNVLLGVIFILGLLKLFHLW